MNDDPPDVTFACSLTSCFLVDCAQQQQQQFKIPARKLVMSTDIKNASLCSSGLAKVRCQGNHSSLSLCYRHALQSFLLSE